MDEQATRPPLPHGKDREPASSSRNNTQDAQPQTQGPIQPPDYFHGGERTLSPPPSTLEKTMDPSRCSQPNTPAASTTDCISRSSTLNSISSRQSHDSDITIYSQNSPSSDGTVSVFPFSTLGPYPIDPKSLPNGASTQSSKLHNSLLEQYLVSSNASGFPFRMNQIIPRRINRHPTWPDRQMGEPEPNNPRLPPRNGTFPVEKPSSPTNVGKETSSYFEDTQDQSVQEPASMDDSAPKDMDTSGTDVCYDVSKEETSSDETQLCNFAKQADVLSEDGSGLIASNYWMIGSLGASQDGLYCEQASNSWAKFMSQRRKKPPRIQGRIADERARNSDLQYYKSDRERPLSPDSAMLSASSSASTIVTLGGAMAAENCNKENPLTQAEEVQRSRTSKLSNSDRPVDDRSRRSSWSDPDNNAGCPSEEFSPGSGDDEDSTYDELVEGITNLILGSSCVGNVEDRGIPVKLYVHNLLEQILNKPRMYSGSGTLCLSIRNPPNQKKETPEDANEPCMEYSGHCGKNGSSNTNKRKQNGVPGNPRNRSSGDEDNSGDHLEESQSNNQQRVKKLKTSKKGGNFSCPFRKRNPTRFNVRDHGSCALNSFADFALLKRHIKSFHQTVNSSNSCPRCREQFPNPAALTRHLTRPEICSLCDPAGDADPEEGITEETDRALKVRTKDDNVRSWESLWNHLFPDDPPQRIPGSEYEPPIELDEVQNCCYSKSLLRDFIHKETVGGEQVMTDHGFRYILQIFRSCRTERSHEHSRHRLDRDQLFVAMIQEELSKLQGTSQAQQSRPATVYEPPRVNTTSQWESGFVNPFYVNIHDFNNQPSPYPTHPPYGSHLGAEGSQLSAATTLYHSTQYGPAQDITAHREAMAFTLEPILPEHDRLYLTAGGSTLRSSRPSSQSHDSENQRQKTPDTEYTQEQEALIHSQHHVLAGKDGGTGNGGACSCFAFPGGIPPDQPSCTCAPGQGFSEHSLYGVGTRPVTGPECVDGFNSDEDLGPLPEIQ